ncbi:Uncharacterised protein [Mycobacteroides abscessus subsp. abscessus]|nr:Uncharacterised protein [Mycobacteroides abscessus subsp. abscessus]
MHGSTNEAAVVGIDARGVLVMCGRRDAGQQGGAPGACRAVRCRARAFLQSDCGTDYVVRPAGFGSGEVAGFVHAQRRKDIVLHINI